MDNADERVIVSTGATPGATQIHHRDFPEIRAEGNSNREASHQLVNQLEKALDSALTAWRRDAIQKAIADVESFVKNAP
jgi:uncharacterized lipoprotein YddW (UPF0748 family)